MAAALYYLGLACLFTHELDAVTHAEWRLLFVLRGMPDASASLIFVALHVPFFFGLLWLSDHRREGTRRVARGIVAGLLVVHAALHLRLSSTPGYGFHGALSQALILSAGACGIAYLLLQWHGSRRTPSRPGHAA